jgi:cytochrome d ubiquinol oxidase subunit I
VSATTVVISMVAFTLVYGLLAVFWYRLMKRYAVEGVADTERDPSPDNPDNQPDPSDPDAAERPLSFAY